jgi:hypothetical protein
MADNNGNGGGRRQWRTAADNDGTRDWATEYDGEGQERAANNNGIRHQERRSVTYQEYFVTYLGTWTIQNQRDGIVHILRDRVMRKVNMSVQNHCDQFGITAGKDHALNAIFM